MENNYLLLLCALLLLFIAALIINYDSREIFCREYSLINACSCSDKGGLHDLGAIVINEASAKLLIEEYYGLLDYPCSNAECFKINGEFYSCFCNELIIGLKSTGEFHEMKC
ncbi:MAG: hypothetical protein PHS81_02980 [Candidatus Nanoarchaeia archaeon]|nr:hypothetical protein [Candidatus Nanoarchaeia archaeon]